MELTEKMIELLPDDFKDMSVGEQVKVWNDCQEKLNTENFIYYNDSSFFDAYFSGRTPYEMVQVVEGTNWSSKDRLVCFNESKQLESGNSMKDFIDFNLLKMTRTSFIKAFITFFDKLSEDDEIKIHNTYQEKIGNYEDVIYPNDSGFFNKQFSNLTPYEIADILYKSDWEKHDNYVYFGYDTILVSGNIDDIDLCEVDIAEYIYDNGNFISNLGIDTSAIDLLLK